MNRLFWRGAMVFTGLMAAAVLLLGFMFRGSVVKLLNTQMAESQRQSINAAATDVRSLLEDAASLAEEVLALARSDVPAGLAPYLAGRAYAADILLQTATGTTSASGEDTFFAALQSAPAGGGLTPEGSYLLQTATNGRATAAVAVPRNVLDELIRVPEGTLMSLYSPANAIICGNHEGTILRFATADGEDVYYEQANYTCYTFQLANGWKCVALYPKSQPIIEQINVNFLITIAAFLGAAVLVAALAWQLLLVPVRRILAIIEKRAQKNLHHVPVEGVINALQGIVTTRSQLSAQATVQHRLILDSFLQQLFSGEVPEAELPTRLANLGVQLTKPCFQVFHVAVQRGGQPLTETPYPLLVEINAHEEYIFASSTGASTMMLLYNYHPEFKVTMRSFLDLAASYGGYENTLSFTLHESDVYDDILLTGAKAHGLTAHVKALASNPGGPAGGAISCINYDADALNRLYNHILQRDFAGAATCLDETMAGIGRAEADGKSGKFFLYEALKVVLRAFGEGHIAYGTFSLKDVDILYALDAGKLRTALKYLHRWFDEAAGSGGAAENDLLAQIQKSIERNYRSGQFGVHTIAEETGYSYNYISKYFKEKTGENLSDAISARRLALFKELLLSTGENVATLIQYVGYDNQASFIRKFKKAEGVTPSQYRRLHTP